MRDFWLLAGTYFVCGASTTADRDPSDPACMDHAIRRSPARRCSPPWGCFNFVGTTSSGWLADSSTIVGCYSSITELRGLRALLAVLVHRYYTMTLFCDVLRPRLVRNRFADCADNSPTPSAASGRHDLRLGFHRPSARRRVGGLLGACCGSSTAATWKPLCCPARCASAPPSRCCSSARGALRAGAGRACIGGCGG